jgi:hypothetical protein
MNITAQGDRLGAALFAKRTPTSDHSILCVAMLRQPKIEFFGPDRQGSVTYPAFLPYRTSAI